MKVLRMVCHNLLLVLNNVIINCPKRTVNAQDAQAFVND
jgi:hypothetical protein